MNVNKADIHEKREKIRRRYRNADTSDLEIIPAKPKFDFFKDMSEKRVAIYVRVSTDSTQQTSSYEMQQKYYSDFVAGRPNWKLVQIYADEGISGTSLKNRDAFNQMILDCKNGEIDLIITKSVSRWSRNILDGVGCVRELAAQSPPVGVFFENEGLYSLDPDTATILSIHSTMAEQESRTKSASMNSSILMRFSHGLFLTPPLIGYDIDENGDLIINQEEANTVRLIFFMYLYGYDTKIIAETLTTLGRSTKLGHIKWSSSTVVSILRNERHCGDVRAWKTHTPDFLSHRKIKNRNAKPQYYKRDHHEAIISRDDFIAAQQMLDNAKYRGGKFSPQLRVISDGALRGFVSVNPRWGAFKADDYRAASAGASGEVQ